MGDDHHGSAGEEACEHTHRATPDTIDLIHRHPTALRALPASPQVTPTGVMSAARMLLLVTNPHATKAPGTMVRRRALAHAAAACERAS